MEDDTKYQINFSMVKGKRDSDRLVEECLIAIKTVLDGRKISVSDKECRLEVLGMPSHRDDGCFLMFDVKGIKGFDHIEFTIRKTGWGRAMNQPEVEE